jgi:hypothetical protein
MNAMSARLAACRGEMMTSPEPGTDRPGIHTGRTGRRAPITASTSPAVCLEASRTYGPSRSAAKPLTGPVRTISASRCATSAVSTGWQDVPARTNRTGARAADLIAISTRS